MPPRFLDLEIIPTPRYSMMCLLPSTRIVVISSPARAHPSTEIVWQTLHSLKLLGFDKSAPITVVCDGCRPASSLEEGYRSRLQSRLASNPCKFSKRGIVSDEVAANYEEYKSRLECEALGAGYTGMSFLHMESHGGFAMAVKAGLESAKAGGEAHALIVQHDRAFCRRVPRAVLHDIVAHLDSSNCRYVGFPSGTSKLLASKMANVYKLHALLAERTVQLQPPSLRLRPCIFWYDSNHIVNVAQALEIYAPFANAPAELHTRLGAAGVNRFRLRRGDFIEERFGVEQRNLLASLRSEPEACLRVFDWFGTYMLGETTRLPPPLSPSLSPCLVGPIGKPFVPGSNLDEGRGSHPGQLG